MLSVGFGSVCSSTVALCRSWIDVKTKLESCPLNLLKCLFSFLCVRASAVREPRLGSHWTMLTFGPGEPLSHPRWDEASDESLDSLLLYLDLFGSLLRPLLFCEALWSFRLWPLWVWGKCCGYTVEDLSHHPYVVACHVFFFFLVYVVEDAFHQSCWSWDMARQHLGDHAL